ncbi:MAG: hypothetical protein M1831_006405 [Alyxoria varia]|nr:MAG: hypothetical protein M1831_006405 [Alyxoria varia]
MTVIVERSFPRVYPLADALPDLPKTQTKPKKRPWKPKGKFPFFRLPYELRHLILEFALTSNSTTTSTSPGSSSHVDRRNTTIDQPTVDLDPRNHMRMSSLLNIFLASRQLYTEAWPVFYGANTFRLFPTHPQFLHTNAVLLARIPPKYRRALTRLELRLGIGWAAPPRCWDLGGDNTFLPEKSRWVVPRSAADGGGVGKLPPSARVLTHLTSLRRLHIFIECDPSDPVFAGFRISERFYTEFAEYLITRVLELVPNEAPLEFVQVDGWPSVRRSGTLVGEVERVVQAEGAAIRGGRRLKIIWGGFEG